MFNTFYRNIFCPIAEPAILTLDQITNGPHDAAWYRNALIALGATTLYGLAVSAGYLIQKRSGNRSEDRE